MKLGSVLTHSIFELDSNIAHWTKTKDGLLKEIDERYNLIRRYDERIESARMALKILHERANEI